MRTQIAEEMGLTESQYQKWLKAEKILNDFSKSGIKTPVRTDNPQLMDTEKFMQMPETKEVIKKLQKAGIKNSSELGDLGFVPACLVIRFGFEEK